MRATKYLGIGILLLAWAGAATGVTLHVPADYPTIQAGINAAGNGDEIEVAPGTYTENINLNGKAVRLHSSSGDPTDTTIHGTGSGSVVTCTSGETSATVLEGFTITGGAAYDGGGMYNSNSSPTVTNCTFSGNSAYHDGGGMFNYYCSPTVTHCTFSGNWETIGSGSGMYNFTSSPTVTDCTFSDNYAPWSGAGMYNWYCDSLTVTNCSFSSNSASQAGGGLFNDRSNALVTNCTFSGNSASLYGGGMANWYVSPTVANCTFSNNAASSGGGMYNYASSSPTVTNCILWSDSGGEISGSATVAYSDVQGGFAGVGNIDGDPLFVSPGDLHLSPASPCIDAGDNSAVPPDVTTDLDGNPRIQGAAVDMGAYESAEQEIVAELYLHGVAPDLILDDVAPTGTTAQYQDSPGVNRTTFQEIGTWTYVVPPDVNLRLDAARNLYVWLGLKNSDDQGTYFDLRAELLRNEAPIASAQTTNIQGITRNPNKAKEVVVAFDAIGGAAFSPGDVLAIKILTKVTDSGGHNNAVGLRLYYDSLSRPSRFEPASVP
jgi:hypothetical protein